MALVHTTTVTAALCMHKCACTVHARLLFLLRCGNNVKQLLFNNNYCFPIFGPSTVISPVKCFNVPETLTRKKKTESYISSVCCCRVLGAMANASPDLDNAEAQRQLNNNNRQIGSGFWETEVTSSKLFECSRIKALAGQANILGRLWSGDNIII